MYEIIQGLFLNDYIFLFIDYSKINSYAKRDTNPFTIYLSILNIYPIIPGFSGDKLLYFCLLKLSAKKNTNSDILFLLD